MLSPTDRAAGALASPIERLWPDCCRGGPHGPAFVREVAYEPDYTYGTVLLRTLPRRLPAPAAALVGEELDGFSLQDALFLDTETTGLSGGTGTYVFLIGAARFVEDRFVFRQFFLRALHEERAMLHALHEFASGCHGIVSFNGKGFDLPLITNRCVLQRMPMRLPEARHLDLLWPARRVWSRRLSSCALTALERAVLGATRVDDVPGELIPALYFHYLRGQDARALLPVFEHNRRDVVALAALASVLSAVAVEPVHCSRHPVDLLALGRLYLRHGDMERAERCYDQALAGQLPLDERGWAWLGLAEVYGRTQRADAALSALQVAARQGGPAGLEAAIRLAKHLEHRVRDYAAAAAVTAAALRVTAGTGRHKDDLLRRLQRLQRKQTRTAPGPWGGAYDTGESNAFTADAVLPAGTP